MHIEPDGASHSRTCPGYSRIERTEQFACVVLDLSGNKGVVGIDARSRSGLAVRSAGIGWSRVIVDSADGFADQDRAIADAVQELKGIVRVRVGAAGGAGFGPHDKPVAPAGAGPAAQS